MNLFYSVTDKKLFWIPNYYPDNSSIVDEHIAMLNKLKNAFEKLGGKGIIHTDFIQSSRRYKSMRVMYCDITESEVPVKAFHLGSDWDMWKWISN